MEDGVQLWVVLFKSAWGGGENMEGVVRTEVQGHEV